MRELRQWGGAFGAASGGLVAAVTWHHDDVWSPASYTSGASLTVTREARAQIGRGGWWDTTASRTDACEYKYAGERENRSDREKSAAGTGGVTMSNRHAQPDLSRPWWELYRAVTQPASAQRQRRVHRVNDPRGKKCLLRGESSTSPVWSRAIRRPTTPIRPFRHGRTSQASARRGGLVRCACGRPRASRSVRRGRRGR